MASNRISASSRLESSSCRKSEAKPPLPMRRFTSSNILGGGIRAQGRLQNDIKTCVCGPKRVYLEKIEIDIGFPILISVSRTGCED